MEIQDVNFRTQIAEELSRIELIDRLCEYHETIIKLKYKMEVQKGIWTINSGKGDRIYIHCTDGSKTMHPEQLCGGNGLGMYGYQTLKDLAIAILLFEKAVINSESIMGFFNSDCL